MFNDPFIYRRRALLKTAAALGVSALSLGGCATRHAPVARSAQKDPPGTDTMASPYSGALLPVPALPPAGRVALVAPASTTPAQIDEAADWLRARGFEPQLMSAVRSQREAPFDYLAGEDSARAADIHAAFSDPGIHAVWCLQGGFGSWRLLKLLNYALLRAHAKPFIGYSDITALHLAIQRYAGFITFHGPMLTQDMLAGREAPTELNLWDMLQGKLLPGMWTRAPLGTAVSTLSPGVATGRLIGGNLALISALMGTRYEIDTRDAILFIEDVNEVLPRLDRMLSQLSLAGKFKTLRGVLAGTFTYASGANNLQLQASMQALLREKFDPYNIPVLADWPSGHGSLNLTLPLGAQITLDANNQAWRLDQVITRLS